MMQQPNHPMGNMRYRNPKLPTQAPKAIPDRKHAMPKSHLNTIKNLSNVLVFIWLNNGNSFWFFVSFERQNRLVGHAWNGRQWIIRELNLQSVWSYY